MADAIGDILPLAVVVALSPIPIIGVTLMLATPRARSNGLAFLGGWIVGLAVAGAVFLLLSGGAGAASDGGPATWVSVLKIVLGLFMLRVALRQWRGRPRDGAKAPMPKWMQSVDHFKAPKAAQLAVLLSAVSEEPHHHHRRDGCDFGDRRRRPAGHRLRGLHPHRLRRPGRPAGHLSPRRRTGPAHHADLRGLDDPQQRRDRP
ncbi:MAG: GAP family protein [Solirubrobacterales bacterium]